jgi:uncharacterized protein YwbE
LTEPESPHGAPVRLEEARTESDPVLCSHQGSLVLAWMGTDGHINIRTSPESPHGAPVRLEEAISCPWALCSHQGSLVLAWAERLARLKSRFFGVRHINIRTSLESPHGAPVRLEEARVPLGTGPALCSHQGSLVLAWTDTDHRIKILADPQSPYGVPVRLEDARTQAWPALCSHQGSLILAWSGNDRHLNLARLK